MADTRISKILPTVNCSDCGKAVHVREIADHVCDSVPPPMPPLPPLAVDTSPSTIRTRKQSNKSLDSSSPLSGSKFNFQFWTGKAKDTFKNATALGNNNTKKTTTTAQSPNGYEHAITTPSTYEQQERDKKMSLTQSNYQEKTWLPDDDELLSPAFDFTPPFAQYSRKNSTSPAPPASLINKYDRKQPSRSISSDEASPITPRAAVVNDFYNSPPLPPLRRCARCHRDIIKENAIPVNDDLYHSQCYSCFTCRNRLDPRRQPLEYQGRIYCDIDYTMMVQQSPSCATCHQPIAPHVRPTRALGRYYHPEHIRCSHCNKPVDPEMTGLVERKGKIFCRPDFNLLYLPKCRACGRAVEKEAVSAADGKLKGKWHKHCFRCHECHCAFPNNRFYVYKNAPYCRRDYHKMNNSLCKRCDDPVEGRCAQTAEGWRFHPNCFTCYRCQCLITDVYYMSEGRIYCPRDKQNRSERRQTYFQDL